MITSGCHVRFVCLASGAALTFVALAGSALAQHCKDFGNLRQLGRDAGQSRSF